MTDESIFAAALALPNAAERAAYLDRACAGKPELRRQVEDLLGAHAASNLLDQPAVAPAATGAFVPANSSGEASHVGDRIGPYKLMEKIGEGGMGEVWVADQLEPIRRRVALKVIKPGMDSRSVLARFEAERQALALMDHPNIAKVLDARTTANGQPYFVMELVKGVPITEFCDARKLTPRQRLELFVPVCQAIQHAHQKGIIHRDIKPSNVLVELHDDKPVPKVIDFGIAKAVGQQLTEKTIYTGFGALVGTPAYMAPEQASFNALDIDTRADVYALGVLLYELLAGSPPFEPERLKKAALDEVLRMVREEDPPRPSARVSTSQTRASIASVRQSDPDKLSKLMRGELDWIVMKSLEKDRSRRYDTAASLGADVHRYLSGEPVLAVPPSPMYRLKKTVRKNRGLVTAATVIGVALLAAIVGGGIGVIESRKQRQVALLLEQTEQARADAVAAQDQLADEKRQTERARDDLARVEYARTIDLAHREYCANNLARGQELLDSCPQHLRGWEWNYVHRQFNESRATITHKQGVSAAMLSRDGRNAVTTQPDGMVLWWHIESGHMGGFRDLPAGEIESVSFNADESLLLVAGMNKRACVHDLKKSQTILKVDHPDIVYCATFSPDGKRFATTCQDRIARVWDTATGDLVFENKKYPHLYGPISYHPDGGKLLTIDGDKAIRIWNAATGVEIKSIEIPDYPRTAAYSPDGSKIACALADKTTRLFDAESGKQLKELKGQRGDIRSLAFSPDGTRLATAGEDHVARIWDVATGVELAVLRGHAAMINCVAFAKDGKSLITVSDDHTARIWDANELPSAKVFRPKTGVFSLGVSPDSSAVAVGGTRGEVQVWNLRSGKMAWSGKHAFDWVNAVAFSPDGRRVASAGSDHFVRIWDAKTGAEITALNGHTNKVECVTFSPDGALIVSTSLDETIRVWDASTGAAIHTAPIDRPAGSVAFSRDGSLLAVGSWNQKIHLWETKTWKQVRSLETRGAILKSVCFSGDGKRLASRSVGGTVRIWNTETWQVVNDLACPREDGIKLALNPDGSRVVTCGKDGTIHIWDTRSGAELLSPVFKELVIDLRINPATVYPVVFTPDGNQLITAGFDQSFRVWDATPVNRRFTAYKGAALSREEKP